MTRDDYIKDIKLFGIKLGHFCICVALFYPCWLLFRYKGFPAVREAGYRYNYFMTAGYAILLLFFNRTYNAYLLGYTRIRTIIFSQFLAQLFSICIVWGA